MPIPFSRILLLLITCIFSGLYLRAQPYKENTPLHQFLQANFDSTIIYYNWTGGAGYFPNYYILAKKDTHVFYFRYTSPYSRIQGRGLPGSLAVKFANEHYKFGRTLPDTNQYFLPVYVHHSVINSNWVQVNSFGIWQLKSVDGANSICEVHDAAYDTYYLISKSGIKTLAYYGADDYEDCGPSDGNRQREIQTRNFIRSVFKD